MSFPITPFNGDQYTTPLGTMYQYDSTSNAWYIVSQVMERGDTGLQGPIGPFGGPPGETGITGLRGFQGVTGLRGYYGFTGIQGVTGVATTSLMASTYNTNFIYADTTSSTFVNIPNLSTTLVLDSSSYIFTTMSFQASSAGQGSYPTGAFRLVITPGPGMTTDTSGSELQKFFTPDNIEIGSVTHYDGFFAAPASYTIQAQFRRVSGQQSVRFYGGQIFAQSFTGERGMPGLNGVTGIFGTDGTMGVTGLIGPSGSTGIQGITGIGVTGIYGLTGVYGRTGLQGRTGLIGVTGVTWFRPMTTDFKVLTDTTTSLFNSTSWSTITDMSSSVTIDSSGSYIFALLSVQTDSSGPGSYVSGGLRLTIDGTSSMEFDRYVQDNDDVEINTIDFRTGPFNVGTYNVIGEAHRIDGDRYFRVKKGHLYVQALQSAVGNAGPVGPMGITGYTGMAGVTGLAFGSTGVAGIPGNTGIGMNGSTGLSGSGATGIMGLTGLVGPANGPQGATGVSGSNAISYNNISRYQVVNSSGYETWLVSSSTIYGSISWVRTGTSMMINRSAHGHTIGNRVIVRNTNVDYQTGVITSITANAFYFTTVNSGSTFGISAAYSLGFTFAHDGYPSSGGTVSAPTGDHPDCQLLSMSLRTGVRNGTIYDLVVPASSINGAGTNTSLATLYMPDFNVRNDADSLTVVGASMVTGSAGSGSYSTFRFGALGSASLSRLISVHF